MVEIYPADSMIILRIQNYDSASSRIDPELKILNFSEHGRPLAFGRVSFSSFKLPLLAKSLGSFSRKSLWSPFFNIFQQKLIQNWNSRIFFRKSGSVIFEHLWTPNFMQKIKKILRANSEKSASPTNQRTGI